MRRIDAGELIVPPALADPVARGRLLATLASKDWVVYAKRPFGGPEQVLKYLARYTHRVAISNARLLELGDGRVTFRYKDYADDHRQKTMTLAADEFLRRFVQHVLPKGFVKMRHYGLLANAQREARLASCRRLLLVATWPRRCRAGSQRRSSRPSRAAVSAAVARGWSIGSWPPTRRWRRRRWTARERGRVCAAGFVSARGRCGAGRCARVARRAAGPVVAPGRQGCVGRRGDENRLQQSRLSL